MSDTDSAVFHHSQLGVRTYDLFAESASASGPIKGDIDFYIACAHEFDGPILELATNTGRVLWPIAAAGFEIAGLDISTAMLAQARAKAAREEPATRDRGRSHRVRAARSSYRHPEQREGSCTFRHGLRSRRPFGRLGRELFPDSPGRSRHHR
jgi:SAM-dependent methyltransferase